MTWEEFWLKKENDDDEDEERVSDQSPIEDSVCLCQSGPTLSNTLPPFSVKIGCSENVASIFLFYFFEPWWQRRGAETSENVVVFFFLRRHEEIENSFFTVRQIEVKVRDLGKSDIFYLMQVQLNYKDRIIRKQNW